MSLPLRHLVVDTGAPGERRYAFRESIEIRRGDGDSDDGTLYVDDRTVSAHHCTVTQSADGRCFVRDSSRNGTRIDGRRLVPNVEQEIFLGQVISVGRRTQLRLEGEPTAPPLRVPPGAESSGFTADEVQRVVVTMLVGDIRGYTGLVQSAPADRLQSSVNRLFERLEREVVRQGGTVKEHQGDAIVAFWEMGLDHHAVAACRAALVLEALACTHAKDKDVWSLPDFPLRMDWALATGHVVLHSYGGDHPTGLSVIGEPMVLAFRLEKLADDETGPILACPETRAAAGEAFLFTDLGERPVEGFTKPRRVFALLGPR